MNKYTKILFSIGLVIFFMATTLSSVFATSTNLGLSNAIILKANESKTVSLLLENTQMVDHEYSLSVEGGLNKYESYFKVNNQITQKTTIVAQGYQSIELVLTLVNENFISPDHLIVKTTRDDGVIEIIEFSTIVNQDYGLSTAIMNTSTEVLSGKTVDLTLSITNTGSKNLTGVSLASELPSKWVIIKGLETGLNLASGQSRAMKITIEVPSSQVSGSNTIRIKAISNETIGNEINTLIIVKSNPSAAYWLFGGLILVVGTTWFQFKKYGRR